MHSNNGGSSKRFVCTALLIPFHQPQSVFASILFILLLSLSPQCGLHTRCKIRYRCATVHAGKMECMWHTDKMISMWPFGHISSVHNIPIYLIKCHIWNRFPRDTHHHECCNQSINAGKQATKGLQFQKRLQYLTFLYTRFSVGNSQSDYSQLRAN